MFARRRTDWSSLDLGRIETPQRQAQRRSRGLDPVSRSLAEHRSGWLELEAEAIDRIAADADSVDPRRAPSLRPEPGSALARAWR